MESFFLLVTGVLILTTGVCSTSKAGQSPLTSSTNQAVLRACNALVERFPSLVSFPSDRRYLSQQAQYWASNQADFAPACRLSPETTEQVSILVSRLVGFGDDVHFAVTSGGHSTVHGASNLNDGITLDLSGLASVSVAPDYSHVEVDTGARWLDIYRVLDPLGLTVSGGRAASVGVGGYLLGGLLIPVLDEISLLTKAGCIGGISILSSLHGWSADALLSIEVVLANGTVINTSQSSHSDLFSALKGGSNNFGIATRFCLRTFLLREPLRVNLLRYAHDQLPEVTRCLADFARNAPLDPSSSAELSVGFDGLAHQTVYVLMLTRAESDSNSNLEDESPLWEPFLEIPTIEKTLFRAGMSEVAEMIEMNNPYGFRVYKTTLTVRNDPDLLSKITDLFTTRVVPNRTLDIDHQHSTCASNPLFRAGMLIQPLTLPHLHYAQDQGTRNLMGLEDEEEPLMLLSFESQHLQARHDEESTALITSILDEAETVARRRGCSSWLRGDGDDGALHPFRYINYAGAGQDVWALLEMKKGRMEEVGTLRDLYDPHRVMERRVQGGFKLG